MKLAASPAIHRLCTGAGAPVLFLHGLPTSCRLWDQITGRICGRFRCIAVDLPGLGRSPSLPGGFGQLDALADSIEKLRIESGIEQWHIVGHDAGCAVAVEYAHRHPHRVVRLALLTPSIFPELRPFALFELLRKPVVGELVAPAVNLFFWKIIMRQALDDHAGQEDNALLDDFQAPFHGAAGAWRLMSLLRWGNPAEVLGSMPEKLFELSAPTLIFHGTRDPVVPPSFATRAASLIPDSEAILLDSGHFLPLSEPAVIASKIGRFFGAAEAHLQTSAATMTVS